MHLSAEIPDPVVEFLARRFAGAILGQASLFGGVQSDVRRLQTSTGQTFVLKQHSSAPPDWYAREADGLELLDRPGCPRTPEVYLVGEKFLLLEDLNESGRAMDDLPAAFWEEFGRALARLHLNTDPLFGLPYDNYLGLMPQQNDQTTDGHAFFVERRVLRYLYEPIAERTLTAEDRRGVEHLCERIRRDVPAQPASLCHGDLWTANMLAGPGDRPAYFDPAVHYGWAEAELSLTRQFGGIPNSFYRAYNELNPLQPGWETRMPLYELKEMLGLIAQFGDEHDMVGPLRALIQQYE